MKEKVNNLVLFDKVGNEELWSWLARRRKEKKEKENPRRLTSPFSSPSAFQKPTDQNPAPLQATYDKLIQEVPKYKMITPSILSDRLRINGSLARAAIRHLLDEGAIRPIVESHHQYIYTRATNA